jgi:hypothetical protein
VPAILDNTAGSCPEDKGAAHGWCHGREQQFPAARKFNVAEMQIVPQGRWAPPVRMLKLTEARSLTPYKWVHPDEES